MYYFNFLSRYVFVCKLISWFCWLVVHSSSYPWCWKMVRSSWRPCCFINLSQDQLYVLAVCYWKRVSIIYKLRLQLRMVKNTKLESIWFPSNKWPCDLLTKLLHMFWNINHLLNSSFLCMYIQNKWDGL